MVLPRNIKSTISFGMKSTNLQRVLLPERNKSKNGKERGKLKWSSKTIQNGKIFMKRFVVNDWIPAFAGMMTKIIRKGKK
jgi:hypothetical protein